LVFTPEGTVNSTFIPVNVDSNHHLRASYEFKPQDNIRPFSTIDYLYVVSLLSGQQFLSDTFSFEYFDNRHTWQTLKQAGLFKVHWFEGDLTFGQAVMDAALYTIENFKQYLVLPNPEEMDIYIYPNQAALQETINLAGQDWLAGYADPDLNLVLTSITPRPDQQLEIQRHIPHEITHVRLYQFLGDSYHNLPAWLNEGLASLAEFYQNPDYKHTLETSKENGSLLLFETLCSSFPANTTDAGTAYAQSDSFVRFIHQEYGSIGLQNLMNAYAQGHSCENGAFESLGNNLSQLESQWWQATFNENPPQSRTSLLAWIILLIFALLVPTSAVILSSRKR
jgi:hypothetical protein